MYNSVYTTLNCAHLQLHHLTNFTVYTLPLQLVTSGLGLGLGLGLKAKIFGFAARGLGLASCGLHHHHHHIL